MKRLCQGPCNFSGGSSPGAYFSHRTPEICSNCTSSKAASCERLRSGDLTLFRRGPETKQYRNAGDVSFRKLSRLSQQQWATCRLSCRCASCDFYGSRSLKSWNSPALCNSEGLGTGRTHQWLARQEESQAKAVVHARHVVPATRVSQPLDVREDC